MVHSSPFAASDALAEMRVTPPSLFVDVSSVAVSGISELPSLKLARLGSYEVCDTDEDESELLSLL